MKYIITFALLLMKIACKQDDTPTVSTEFPQLIPVTLLYEFRINSYCRKDVLSVSRMSYVFLSPRATKGCLIIYRLLYELLVLKLLLHFRPLKILIYFLLR